MNIVMLTGSPRPHGSSNQLADAFVNGAQAAGHHTDRFDAAVLKINPCRGCGYCLEHDNRCVQKDAMQEVNAKLVQTNALILVSPVYYFGISSQLKAAVDRFYAVNDLLMARGVISYLILTAADTDPTCLQEPQDFYKHLARYLQFRSKGILLAHSLSTPEDLAGKPYLEQAYQAGFTLAE